MPRITDEEMIKNLNSADTMILPSGIMMISNREGFVSLTDDDGVVLTSVTELTFALEEYKKRWDRIPFPISGKDP